MPEKKTPTDLIATTQQAGLVRNIVNQLKLIFRLMGDSRVSVFAKLIPVGALAYLIWPVDAINVALPFIGPLDDAALLWLGSYIFTEFCPPAVVEEHMKEIYGITPSATDEVIDAETTDVKEEPPQQ